MNLPESEDIRFLLDGLDVDGLSELRRLVELARAGEYERGFRDGLRAYAWWKDGVQYVGTTGRTLKEALEEARQTWCFFEQVAPR